MTRLAETIRRARIMALEEAREALAQYHERRGFGITLVGAETDMVMSGLIEREEGK